MSVRTLIVGIAVTIGGVLSWSFVWRAWAAYIDTWGRYTTSVLWLDTAMLVLWAAAFIFFVVVGALFAILARPGHPLAAGVVVGTVVGAVLLSSTTHIFTEDALISSYVWTYGTYAIVATGVAFGSALASRF
jgi:hypothetical protein